MNVCNQQMACADVFCPYLACSFGAHIFNLHNNVGIDKKYPSQENDGDANICSSGLKPRNVKMNVILVSPPGLSKNESINRFVDNKYGILTVLNEQMDILPDGTEPQFCRLNGEITSAGFVGTIKAPSKDDSDNNEQYGDAFIFRKGILAYTEIASLFGKADHSTDLINHVLRVMGDNQIIKRLAHIDIFHDTWVTIWGGIQPARIVNIDNSGMDRRAVFVFHEWTDEEIRKMLDFRAKKKTISEIEQLKNDYSSLKEDIKNFVEDVKGITDIEWMFDRKQFATMPADLDVIEGLCIGYNLLVSDLILGTLEVNLHPELEKMLNEMKKMKDNLRMYEGIIVSIKKLKENKGITTREIYLGHFKNLGYTYAKCQELLEKAHNLGFIEPVRKTRGGGTKWNVIEDMVSGV